MLRSLNLLAAALVAVAAASLYAIKYDARRIEARVQSDERRLERLEDDIAVLKAERAHLARPERIEALARNLGLATPSERQLIRLETLTHQGSGPDRRQP